MRKIYLLIAAFVLAVPAVVSSPSQAKNLIPYTIGNKWEYSVAEMGVMSFGEPPQSVSHGTFARGTYVSEIISEKERRADGIVYLERDIEITGPGMNVEASKVITEGHTLVSEKGIFCLAQRSSETDGVFSGKWVRYNPPLVALEAWLTPGKKWWVGTFREDGARMPMEARVMGLETVTVPAGTFKDCLKVCTYTNRVTGGFDYGERTATIESGKNVHFIWIYPGVGIVKYDTASQIKMTVRDVDSGQSIMLTGTHRKIRELQPGYTAK